jgi:hypothetical protein
MLTDDFGSALRFKHRAVALKSLLMPLSSELLIPGFQDVFTECLKQSARARHCVGSIYTQCCLRLFPILYNNYIVELLRNVNK